MTTEQFDAHLRSGRGRLMEHWLNHAEDCFQAALKLQPDHPRARHLLGVTRCRMRRYDDGIALITGAMDAAPDNLKPAQLIDLSAACHRAGRVDEARQAWSEAVAAVPGLAAQPAWVRHTFVSERIEHRYTVVDYESVAHGRHDLGRGSHSGLRAVLERRRPAYEQMLAEMGALAPLFARVPAYGDYGANTPFWINSWMAPLDGMSLMAMLARHRPRRYLEVGSGMSTKFARLAIDALGLKTQITSIDPQPRNRIEALIDQKIRARLETVDLSLFDTLEAGDILFFDGSHRSFPGSDVTVFFLEILPRLKPGVVVHIHDIYLPDDYVAGHVPRLWNEQYLLACALLYGGQGLEVDFPAWFVATDPALCEQVDTQLQKGSMAGRYLHGMSFWLRTCPRVDPIA